MSPGSTPAPTTTSPSRSPSRSSPRASGRSPDAARCRGRPYSASATSSSIPRRTGCTRGGKDIDLSPKEFALLELFLRHPDEVLTRTAILEHAWDFAYDGTSNVVDVYVRYLREKIDRPFGRRTIETVRGVGYRLRSAVVRLRPRTLRGRITLVLALVTVVLSALVGVLVDVQYRSALNSALDETLADPLPRRRAADQEHVDRFDRPSRPSPTPSRSRR